MFRSLPTHPSPGIVPAIAPANSDYFQQLAWSLHLAYEQAMGVKFEPRQFGVQFTEVTNGLWRMVIHRYTPDGRKESTLAGKITELYLTTTPYGELPPPHAWHDLAYTGPPLPKPKPKEVTMKLVLEISLMKLRPLQREFLKYANLYAKTFDIRTAQYSQGLRFLMGTEKANISVLPVNSSQEVIVNVAFESPPSSPFMGRLVAFLGAFLEHLKHSIGTEDMTLVADKCDVPDLDSARKWGKWAHGEVTKKFPKA